MSGRCAPPRGATGWTSACGAARQRRCLAAPSPASGLSPRLLLALLALVWVGRRSSRAAALLVLVWVGRHSSRAAALLALVWVGRRSSRAGALLALPPAT
jgi:hypothetical protein